VFNYDELKGVQIEITNRCQASCPMCPRNIHGGITNPLLEINDWSLEDFKTILPTSLLQQLEFVTFCGDFGEPIINDDLPEMCRYLRETNPDITVNIHTNGSARNEEWWRNLRRCLPDRHEIFFALDGLVDTHHLYRQGTQFSKILENAKSFIDAGGRATWVFIKFKHNQHQLARAREMSREYGFINIEFKDSKRFKKSFPVLDKAGNITHYLDQPEHSVIEFVGRQQLEDYQRWTKKSEIDCMVKRDKEIYIDANYVVSPCCMVGSFLNTYYDNELYQRYGLLDGDSIEPVGKQIQVQVFDIVELLGGLEALNALTSPIKDIIENPYWHKWATSDSDACIVMCSEDTPYISIEQQKATEKNV